MDDETVLDTDRLVLRASRESDAELYHRLWTERDLRVPPHRRIGSDGRPTTADVAAGLRAELGTTGPRLLAVERKLSGDVIGYCGLVTGDNGSPAEPELAYELLRSAHGRGYATEAGQAVVSWAVAAGCSRLWAGVWDWNHASRRVLAKLGFRETGRATHSSIHGHSLLTVRELC